MSTEKEKVIREEYKKQVNYRRSTSFEKHCGSCLHRSTFTADSPGTGCYLYDAYIGDTLHKTEFGWMGSPPIHGTICDAFEDSKERT